VNRSLVAFALPLLAAACALVAGRGAWAQSQVVTSGFPGDPPPFPEGVTAVQLGAGYDHSVALLSDGSIVAWGGNVFGQCDVPPLPRGVTYVQVAAGLLHNVAVRSDGEAVGWGNDVSGQSSGVPPLPDGLAYVQAAAGYRFSALRLSDGTVTAWGINNACQKCVLALPEGVTYADISGGYDMTVARRSDGTVVNWGTAATVPELPVGMTYVDSSAGGEFGGQHGVALRSDGAVVAWGSNGDGESTVPEFPEGLSCVAVVAGGHHSLAILSDGSVQGWGKNNFGQTALTAPYGMIFEQVAAGRQHSLGLVVPVDTLGVILTKGKLTDSLKPGKDAVALAGNLVFTEYSDAAFDPLTEAVTLTLGSADAPLVVEIPAGDPGWKSKNGKHTWKSAKDVLPKVLLVLDIGKSKFRAKAARFDFTAAPTNPISVEISAGNDTASVSESWENAKPGKFKLP